jgi:hypothetical protein
VHFARHSQHYGEKELGREMLFNIAPNAHQKLKMQLVSRGFGERPAFAGPCIGLRLRFKRSK